MADKKTPTQERLENILQKSMDEVLHDSMLPYAEHIILERALPRVEDGLKPVQRRILYTMLELGLTPDKPHRKSARIVGDCLGKYHPHGDSSVYDAMVRMAQPFNMGLPLVDGHGNFGSVDGDSAAAMRYTEARMTPAAMQLLRDLDMDTVPFMWNFDDTLKEPELLPGRFPNLLVNGASGIAIGLATNIPPHNPQEAIDAVILRMEKPNCSLDELMQCMPAPDFPTGAYLLRSEEIRRAYETGRGKLTLRAKSHFEPMKNGKTRIVFTELPFTVNKAALLEKILQVTQEKKALFSAVSDIRDESDRNGMCAVVEVKKDGDPERILQYLYKYSDLQCTFGVNLVAIAEGRPQQLSLIEILDHYIRHQREVVTRRTKNELEIAEKREHILAGLMIAVDNVDEVIRLIRASKTPKEARERLMARFELSEAQAQAILDLRLQRLTNLEILTIEREYAEVEKRIAELKGILASDKKLTALIKKELLEERALFLIPRRTKLLSAEQETPLPEAEALPAEPITMAILEGLKLRRCPRRQFSLEAIRAEQPLFIRELMSDGELCIFTDHGAVLTLRADDVPEGKPNAKPTNLAALLPFEKDEKIIAVMDGETEGEYLFACSDGMVKRSLASEYRLRSKRSAAINLKEGAKLLSVQCAKAACDLLALTKLGMSIRFAADSVPLMGRSAAGVKCIKPEADDELFALLQVGDEGELIVITDRGYGKRSFLFEYEKQGRNGKGARSIEWRKNASNGTRLIYADAVTAPYTLLLRQRHGTETPLPTEQIRIEGKAARGTLLVPCVLDDDVIAVTRLEEKE